MEEHSALHNNACLLRLAFIFGEHSEIWRIGNRSIEPSIGSICVALVVIAESKQYRENSH